MSFSKLGLTPALCAPLVQKGYLEPTPVQAAAIPLVLDGADVLARAQTGTGKTAAFALPMIDRLVVRGRRPGGRPRGLVLVPTRELAQQVHASFVAYGASMRVRVAQLTGGVGMGGQFRALRGAEIIVATPGRLIDHLDRRTVDLSGIEMLTLDEGDRMLDMGFLPPLRRILTALPPVRQTLLFSATMSAEVMKLAAEFTRDAKRVDVTNGDVVATTVTHRLHPVAHDRKRESLLGVLMEAPRSQALVFCKTKRGADRIGACLDDAGLQTAVIHGDKSQGARTRSLADFKAGRVRILVATDLAARGLDIVQLPLVVNYDLPLVAADYIHRVGRTGRAGEPGRAVSLVTTADRPLLREIQRLLPAPLEQVGGAEFSMTGPAEAPRRPAGGFGAHGQSRRPAAPRRRPGWEPRASSFGASHDRGGRGPRAPRPLVQQPA